MTAVDVVCLWFGRAWSAAILLALGVWIGSVARDALFRRFDRHAEVRLARSRPVPYRLTENADVWVAVQLSQLGQPCPPVLADEIAGRRRAKAGQS